MEVAPQPRLQNHTFASPLRYPGGKGALANFIKTILIGNDLLDSEYIEVYGGGASIAWALLFDEFVRRVHVNDIDPGVMAFWRCVINDTDKLCRMISDVEVTMDEWYRQRQVQARLADHSELEVAFSTFFLNRTNRSGILKGGVIGGLRQTGRWLIDARFHKRDLIRRIERIARYSGRISLYQQDAVTFIKRLGDYVGDRALVYLDLPYFKKGQDLYENHYAEADHVAIEGLVRECIAHQWIVSYDSAPPILELYRQFPSIHYNISYSANSHYDGTEVIFHSPARGVSHCWGSSPARLDA